MLMCSMLGLPDCAACVDRKSANTWHARRYRCSVLAAKWAKSLLKCLSKCGDELSCWNASHAGPMRCTRSKKFCSHSLRAASLRALAVEACWGTTGAGGSGFGLSPN